MRTTAAPRFGDAEAEAFLQIECHLLGVVAGIADGEVLPDVQEEVAAPLAGYQSTVETGRPDEVSAEDVAEMLLQRIAPVFGGRENVGVSLRIDDDDALRAPKSSIRCPYQPPRGVGKRH